MFVNLPDGYRLFYTVYNTHFDPNKKTIIFLHGGPGIADHSLYVDYWQQLQDKHTQVVFIDMRGHGQSAEANKEMDTENNPMWNLKQWGKDLHDGIAALGIYRPIIAGVSFGGWVTLSYATQFPEHASGLILCATEAKVGVNARMAAYERIGIARGKPEQGKAAAKVVATMAQNPIEQSAHDYKTICIPLFSGNPYTPAELAKMKTNQGPWIKFNAEEYYNFNLLDELKKISAKILYLVGELDPEHPLESAHETFAHMRKETASLKIIAGAGAPPYRDKPAEVLNILRDFVAKI